MHDDQRPTRLRILKEELIGNLILSHIYYPVYAKKLNLAGHERVLEFGSGGGLLSRSLARILLPEGLLTCIDISQYWVNRAQVRLRNFPNIEFICGDVTKACLHENHFDTVAIHFALHEVAGQDRTGVISALASLLRPEGILHIREPARTDHGMQLDEIRTLMREAGLREQRAGCTQSWLWETVCDGIFVKSW